ncbi:hypothetical protein [Cupriavidus sp. SK-3]|uniref:hypothetical protein n=1 Tax=Cupriavidus sp. SK-3 TaxID=1470558 RepID=UPI001267CEA4|nr:hypothetical protein [Cupriavidus sp. SK-3]
MAPVVDSGSVSDRLSRLAIPADTTLGQARQNAGNAAVNERAELLTRDRREWSAVRNLACDAIRSKGLDPEKARTVKTAAEAVKTIQDGERRAWGAGFWRRGEARPQSGSQTEVVDINGMTRLQGVEVPAQQNWSIS